MSTLKVNAIESQAADSAPTIAGLQFPTAGPLSNRNLIINGAMNVAQRGTSATNSGFGSVDRFSCGFSGGAQTQAQHTLTNSTDATVWDLGFRKSLRITNTTSSTIASSFRRITYFPEAQDIACSGWDYENADSGLTLSFWVRASVSQQYTCCIYTSDGTPQAYTFAIQDDGGSTLSANTWTKIPHTLPGNANIQVDNDTGAGLQIDFVAWWGTDFTGTKAFNSWAAFGDGTDRTADMTNTWAGTTDATFEITGVQLEVGDKATPFEHRRYGDDLIKCQRYWNKIIYALCNPISGIAYRIIAPGPAVQMRVTPGVSYYHPSTGTANQTYEHSSSTARTINSVVAPNDSAPAQTTYFGMSTSATYAQYVNIHYSAEF